MKTYFLKFADEIEALNMLHQYRVFDDQLNGNWLTASHEHTLDVIGEITKGGQWDENGVELVAPVKLDGYHVNLALKSELPADLEKFAVIPKNPSRVFA